MLGRLAELAGRRRRLVLALTVAWVVVAGGLGAPVVGLLDSDDDFEAPGAEAIAARDAYEGATNRSASPDLVALVRLPAPLGEPAADRAVARAAAALDAPGVAGVAVPGQDGPPELIARDRRAVSLVATFQASADPGEVVEAIEARLPAEPAVLLGGPVVAADQVGSQIQEDLTRAELVAFPVLFLLSLLVFRGVVAALLPLAVGLVTILTTFLALRVVNAVEPMSVFAVNLITGLGLGLAIDYSLFVVSRFREELPRGPGALGRTMRTAGRTVLFSAVTVGAALAALMVFPQRFLFSMGVGGLLVALSAAAVSLTVLPALLAVLGPRVDALSPRRWRRAAAQEHQGRWYRFSRAVMRRPGPVAAAAAVLLIVLGLPFLRVEFTGVDASVLPQGQSARVVNDALERDFPPDRTSPVYVIAGLGERGSDAAAGLARRLARLDGAAAVAEPEPAGGHWRIDVAARGEALDEPARRLVRDIRALDAPFPLLVGGATAQFLDQQAALADALPLGLGLLAVTTLVLLFLMTGSVVLPVKALVMNLLTVSAAFGLLVLVFQDGRLEDLLGYESQGALEATQPVLIFAVAFGLSTDYGVFLLTRIKEAHDAGLPDREAVAVGLERTGRIVTYAALLLCVALGAFALSEVVFIKQVGLGTAFAVLVDAFLVRALLVPTLMALLGRWNWWAPEPLARLHRRVGAAA